MGHPGTLRPGTRPACTFRNLAPLRVLALENPKQTPMRPYAAGKSLVEAK